MTYAETLEARVRELERRVAELETALRRGRVVETAPANG
jgi:polyhydroxyalkanoate synthesis regulator phasin